jgi:hypothetical protein
MAPPPERALGRGELNRATLARQGLLEPLKVASVADAVERVGSLQAQHPEWPPIALWSRAGDGAIAGLAMALEDRSVVRSSLMRITIHVVSAGDFWPMSTVCRPMRLEQWRLLVKADPIESPLGRRLRAAHPAALAAMRERPRSPAEIEATLRSELGRAAPELSSRLLMRHLAAVEPLVHVRHDGEGYGRSRYAVAADWIGPPTAAALDPDAAMEHVTVRYLAAFGPATTADLMAYVGRRGSIRPWRAAFERLGDRLVRLRDEAGRELVDLADAPRPPSDLPAPPRLIARWDSLLLSHEPRHRGRVIADEHRAAVFSKNADVLPTILVDGFVAGTWWLDRDDTVATLRITPFGRLATRVRQSLEEQAERLIAAVAPDSTDRAVRVGS